MNKIIALLVGAAVMVGSGAFYAGMKYGRNKGGAAGLRQARMQQFGGGNGLPAQAGGPSGQRGNGGFVSGEIISKDDKIVTVKLQNGGSKIVFVSDSTAVVKSTAGALSDVAVGEQITAMGSPNADGSISAQSIQIRPTPPPAAPSSDSSPAQSANIKEFTVTGQNYSFSPATMAVKKGDKVKITFKNADGFHDFKIDEFNVATHKLQTGGEETIEFIADKTGSFEYYCSVGNHRAMGMKGKLIVE